ncbi:uncharacterized protein BO97DRAFT_253674 [Aspergillus homomorphus CBS 101889]|uniref:Uncharacterized protein n=1 Tax=Aspergillus homomorphus (strain CBS 101889) TaxID=1450537 RepID=A0A395HJI6_ASPHC|nr:hypothetical protein BO97DRAFT_253674 [Aspergillus homomorphus CBS 101889]RAL07345.1 hypothetical protein BO97DRAFT_253674 [Aspergillus homomorphus CBS 101889]
MVNKRPAPPQGPSRAPKRTTPDRPEGTNNQLLSLPVSPIRLLPNQDPITLDEFLSWPEIPLPPAIPAFHDLEPQPIRVGLSRDLPLHKQDNYIHNPAYEPVYLIPNTRSSTYSLLQLGGDALPPTDVLLHRDFKDPKTRLFVARNSLQDYHTRLTAAVTTYHATLQTWRTQRRNWEAGLLIALGRQSPEETASMIRSELTKDKYRPWFVGSSSSSSSSAGVAEYTNPHTLRDGPVAFALRKRLDHVARTISDLTEQLVQLSRGGDCEALGEVGGEDVLDDANPGLDRARFVDWAVERALHWRLAAQTGMIPEFLGLVDLNLDLGAVGGSEEAWRPGREGLFMSGVQGQMPWGLPAYRFQWEIQRLKRAVNDLFEAEIMDLLFGVEEWYFGLEERERVILRGVALRFWPMPAGLYKNVGEVLGFTSPFGD